MTSIWLGRSFFFGIFLSFSAANGQAIKHDWLIVPGVRIGPIRASTSDAELRKVFGPGAVEAKEVEFGEGLTEPGTIVYGGVAGKALAILWKEKSRKSPSEVFVCYGQLTGSGLWRTPDGISFGTTLKDLERRNGRPFLLSGFGWDYSGTVVSWEGGSLLKLLGSLIVRLSDANSIASTGIVERREVIGDQDIPSNQTLMQKINPTVCALRFTFPE